MIHENVSAFYQRFCGLAAHYGALNHSTQFRILETLRYCEKFPEITENKKKSTEKSINHQNTISKNGMEVTRLMDSVES